LKQWLHASIGCLELSILPGPGDRIPRGQPQPGEVRSARPPRRVAAKLEEILAEPGLCDEALLPLARNGFDVGADAAITEWRTGRTASEEMLSAWKTVYAAAETHWVLYELAEKLGDSEDYFRRWRFKSSASSA